MWLSTCDRVEVLAASDDPARAAAIAADALAERAGMTAQALAPELYTLTGGDAVRHLFAVACSLDSQVVGEPHVLGQVKAAHRASIAAHISGPELEAVLQAAYAAAKRVRTETAIAERPVSIAAAAVQTARDIHGELDRSSCLLIGLGRHGRADGGGSARGGASPPDGHIPRRSPRRGGGPPARLPLLADGRSGRRTPGRRYRGDGGRSGALYPVGGPDGRGAEEAPPPSRLRDRYRHPRRRRSGGGRSGRRLRL